MKKLPLGIQTFPEIRSNDYIYVDKSGIAKQLIDSHKYVFLSRPRRFGKSLFVSTLQALFEGKKSLFEGLAIENTHDWGETFPVIRIDLSGNQMTLAECKSLIVNLLKNNQARLGLSDCEDDNISNFFENIIHAAYQQYGQRVVILVDEYDKPILDNIHHPELAESIRDLLQGFYTTIKKNDEFLRFAFLTGVSKFSKVSVFSGLNNLTDISLNSRYATICGYTQNDIDTTFAPYLENVDKTMLRDWYNGYQFNGKNVYNPYGILRFIDGDCEFKNYWFESGTPTFLIKQLQRKSYYLPDVENLRVDSDFMSSASINDASIESLLFQTGYLTLDAVEPMPMGGVMYRLRYPNKEVRMSLANCLIEAMTQPERPTVDNRNALYLALQDADGARIRQTLEQIFATIPYHLYSNTPLAHYEGYYSVVMYSYLLSLGLEIELEKTTNKGRLDMVIDYPDKRYLIEFKMTGRGDAVTQIVDNRYFQAFLGVDKPIYLLGIHFDEAERNVSLVDLQRFEHNQ